jgi:hypothetical protein
LPRPFGPPVEALARQHASPALRHHGMADPPRAARLQRFPSLRATVRWRRHLGSLLEPVPQPGVFGGG